MLASSTTSFGRAARVAALAVFALSATFAVIEVGRVGTFDHGSKLAVAIVATALCLPLHLWHLEYGLRGERPPRSGATLAFMAAVNLAALMLIGPAWSLMLALVATSALVVLRPPWSLVALAACACGPVLGQALHHDPGYYSHSGYLGYSVVMRAGIQFAIVWLVAAVHQLAASRAALATDATQRERARLQDEVRASLDGRLSGLADAARAARVALSEPGVAAPVVALDRTLRLAADALADLRAVVIGARREDRHEAASALAQSTRAGRSPVGRGLTTRRAWWTFGAVQALSLGFLVCGSLRLLAPWGPHDPLRDLAVCAAIAALWLPASLAVARGRRVSRPLVRLGLMVVVVAAGQVGTSGEIETACWFVGAMAVVCLPGRWAIAALAAAVAGYLTYDTIAYTIPYPLVTPYFYVWNVAHGATVMLLVVAGLYASARLVAIASQLDAARDELAEHAARAECRRMSRDLHDVLGQALTAISLKGDLARRLVAHDRAGATREVDGLAIVATSLATEMESVARGEREVAFVTETETAAELLRAAGVAVTMDLRVERLDADTSSLLGWVIREGATNILRHADARTCSIRAVREHGTLRLEVVNDGAIRPRRDASGTGLLSLADRAVAARGQLEGAPVGDGRFRLRLEIPA